jgi:O-acetyl-ADP-ribose deacetylase (regulator of RNase III)
MNGFRIVLFSPEDLVCEAWEKEFSDVDEVEIFQGALENVPACDCLGIAGNSFGIMDADADTDIRLQFPDVQQNVQQAITTLYAGEMPVGQSLIVATGDETFRWAAYTPSMRFPRNIPVEQVYDCMRVTLLAIKQHNMTDLEEQAIAEELGEERDENVIESIVIPAFGTSAGVGAFKAARMMRLGYESVFEREPVSYTSWDDVDVYLKKLHV